MKITMKRCTTVIKRLTYAYGDFKLKGNFNESAARQSLKADHNPSILQVLKEVPTQQIRPSGDIKVSHSKH